MWKILREVGLYLVLLIVAVGIFLLVTRYRETTQGVLEYSLGLLGDKLLAMLPDGAEKTALKEQYDRFRQQVVQRKVAPEQIENVAANILNVSNIDTTLSQGQAEAVLLFALMSPIEMKSESGDSIESKGVKLIEPEKWESLGERLRSMYEFNEKLQRIMKEYAAQKRDLQRQMQYRVEDGLKLALDASLRNKLNRREYRRLAKELRQLEKKQMLEWRKNFADELKEEMKQMREELQSLQELKNLHRLEALQGLEALKALESLESLEALKYVPVFEADSI